MSLARREFFCLAGAVLGGFIPSWRLLAESEGSSAKLLALVIDRTPVDSTSLASVGYHARSRVLEVEFRSGAVYQYFAVPPPTHAALMGAASKGRFFTQHIQRQFRFRRVLEETR